MKDLTDLQAHIDNAIDWIWKLLPNLILAIIILIVGLWVVKLLNKMVRKFFEKKDYDLTLETFLQSFISIALKIILFVLVVTQLGVKTDSFPMVTLSILMQKPHVGIILPLASVTMLTLRPQKKYY